MYVYFYSLYFSGNHMPIIRRINCINTYIPDGRPHRVTYNRHRIDTVNSPDDGHMVARNMYRIEINIYENFVCQFGLFTKVRVEVALEVVWSVGKDRHGYVCRDLPLALYGMSRFHDVSYFHLQGLYFVVCCKYSAWLQADLRVTVHSHEHERLAARQLYCQHICSPSVSGLNWYLFVLQVSKTDGPWSTTPQLVAEDLK